jgi:hypothetical protein
MKSLRNMPRKLSVLCALAISAHFALAQHYGDP